MRAGEPTSGAILRARAQPGATLVGELLAIAIVAVAFVVLIAGLATSGRSVSIVEQRVAAENYARREMELIKGAPYHANPTSVPYPMVSYSSPYTVSVQVSYWVSPSFTSVMPGTDTGMQKVTVQVYSLQRGSSHVFALEGYKVNRP